MDFLTSLGMSWRAIWDQKLRSTLTTLGVIIGVGAVITFVTLGASLQADVVGTLAGDDQDVIYVAAVSEGQSGIPGIRGGGEAVFTEHDVALLREVDGVEVAVPEGGIAAAGVRFRNDSVGRQWITVTTAEYFEARDVEIAEGRSFVEERSEVVVNRQAAMMFQENLSVGDDITFLRSVTERPVNATVVGIVESGDGDERGSVFSRPARPAIYAPAEPFYERTVVSPATGEDQQVFPQVFVVAADTADVGSLKGRIQTALSERSDARILMPEGYRFEVTTFDERVEQIRQISDTFTAYIVGIALISLLVGAIGIANIMLANVAERRREIGIMKAIGGRNRDILQLFLNEAVLLGVLGSGLGTVVGLAGAWIGTELIQLPFVVDAIWLPVAIAVGVGVGVVSGLYPAWSAARTDPIDALRYE